MTSDHSGLPLDLLDKLLIFVRTPIDENDECDDMDWCAYHAVSSWREGWNRLADEGFVEFRGLDDAVRFTPLGLSVALKRNVSPYALKEQEVQNQKASKSEYEKNPLWGRF